MTSLIAISVLTDRGEILAPADEVGALLPISNETRNALAGKAQSGSNSDITDLLGPGGAGVRFRASSTTMASGPTVDIGAAPTRKVTISGSATISSFGAAAHAEALVHFTDACILINSASLVLPGGINRTVAAGDRCIATSNGSGAWTLWGWGRADGKAYTPSAAADVIDASASGRSVLTGTAAQGATALGLGTGNFPTFAGLAVTAPMQLTDRRLHLRSTGDPNHCLRYMGASRPFGSANLSSPDGPVLHGFGGGTLGIGSSTGGSAVATWGSQGITIKAGSLTVDSGTDGLINLRASNAPVDSYRVGQIYKSINIDGGNSWLFRSFRDDTSATIDHILPFNWPGRILTTGRFNPDADVTFGGVMNFGSRTTQHINLWGNTYAFGVQPNTLFARTAAEFCIYAGGVFENSTAAPGTGGNLLMRVNAGQAAFSGAVKPASYTVATLPTAGTAGRIAWASNGRAYNGAGTLQGAGAGTGVLVTDDGAAWRVAGTNQTVQS